jgi:hypothetical protein
VRARRRRRQPDRPARPVAVGVAGQPPYAARSRPRECLVECRIVTALPLDSASVREVRIGRPYAAEVNFPAPRDGVRMRRAGARA